VSNAIVLLTVSFSPLLATIAQSAEGGVLGSLIQGGTTGAVLAWFMWRNERRMARLEGAWHTYSKVRLLALVDPKAMSPAQKAEAENLLAEIERKE
jgi:hypothetical protein